MLRVKNIKKSKRTLNQGSFFVYLYMKKKILKHLIDKLIGSHVSKIRYFWLRFWIEKLQDPEENYMLIDKYAKAVNLIKDSHVQYQLSNIVNDYFTCDGTLYLISNYTDIYAFGHDVAEVCAAAGIEHVQLIPDHWTGQREMYEHLIFNSLI